jgi:hypothetical protein
MKCQAVKMEHGNIDSRVSELTFHSYKPLIQIPWAENNYLAIVGSIELTRWIVEMDARIELL